MHFFLPRRHRRKLLFPPGLLALAGLLWLGCIALGAHPEQLKQRRVMQLTMVPLNLSRSYYRGYESLWTTILSSPAKIAAFRPWRDIRFIGNLQTDKLEQAHMAGAVLAILSDTLHDGGVRVRFASASRYENLVFALDLMNRASITKYWLDIQHGPATLYTITNAYAPSDSLECEGVGPLNIIIENTPPIPLRTQVYEWIASFWQFTWLKPLAQPEWRPSMYLFAVIALLSSWRMVRNRRNSAFT